MDLQFIHIDAVLSKKKGRCNSSGLGLFDRAVTLVDCEACLESAHFGLPEWSLKVERKHHNQP